MPRPRNSPQKLLEACMATPEDLHRWLAQLGSPHRDMSLLEYLQHHPELLDRLTSSLIEHFNKRLADTASAFSFLPRKAAPSYFHDIRPLPNSRELKDSDILSALPPELRYFAQEDEEALEQVHALHGYRLMMLRRLRERLQQQALADTQLVADQGRLREMREKYTQFLREELAKQQEADAIADADVRISQESMRLRRVRERRLERERKAAEALAEIERLNDAREEEERRAEIARAEWEYNEANKQRIYEEAVLRCQRLAMRAKVKIQQQKAWLGQVLDITKERGELLLALTALKQRLVDYGFQLDALACLPSAEDEDLLYRIQELRQDVEVRLELVSLATDGAELTDAPPDSLTEARKKLSKRKAKARQGLRMSKEALKAARTERRLRDQQARRDAEHEVEALLLGNGGRAAKVPSERVDLSSPEAVKRLSQQLLEQKSKDRGGQDEREKTEDSEGPGNAG